MLGHELRNPLSPILTALQLMKLRGEPGSERERTVIERQVNHLTRLVDDLLDVSRIARGRIELKTELVEMSEVVANAIEMASPLLEQRDPSAGGGRATARPSGGGRRDQARSGHLESADQRGQVHAGRRTDHRSAARQIDDEVVLSVRDTGIGIPPEVLPHVFDLFVQERQALDRSQGGLGIGLTIVRSLIERHGGAVSARSDGPGKGSEFIVRLPVAGRAQRGSPARRLRRSRSRGASPRGAPRASSSSTTTRTAPSCWPKRSAARVTTRVSPTTRRRRCAWPPSFSRTSRFSISGCR